MDGFFDNFVSFWKQPWKGAQEMSVTDWFLWLGTIIVLLAVWRIIFRHIEMEA